MKTGLAVSLAALALVGCQPSIGSRCTLSTDCSSQGNRLCDTAQSAGYCTVLNCIANSCPDNAVCVMFQVSVPGCAYNDYSAPARTGLAMCMEHCTTDSDCRQSDGYVCDDPRKSPWFAAIIDDNQGQRVCIAATSNYNIDAGPDAGPSTTGVCALSLPPLPPLPDAAAVGDGGRDAASALEAGSEADAGMDATGSGADAGTDATVDAGQVDAEGGTGASDAAEDSSSVTDGQ